jgi:Flp pilus assembly pilin Flp
MSAERLTRRLIGRPKTVDQPLRRELAGREALRVGWHEVTHRPGERGEPPVRGCTMEKILKLIVAMHIRVADFREDRGATATEYALLVAFIAIAIIAGVTAFGGALNKFFTDLGSHVGITGANS